jgi:hypothetical protein
MAPGFGLNILFKFYNYLKPSLAVDAKYPEPFSVDLLKLVQ